jgi:hypothetical protein
VDTLKLDTAVGLLTRRSPHRIMDEDGNPRWIVADPLLVQLRMASTPSSSGDGGGSSSAGAPIPLNADAHDLLERIREETSTQWWYTHPIHHGAGRGTLGGELLAWVRAARSNEILTLGAEVITTRWVTDIKALFNPQYRRPLPGVCPNKKCRASRVLDREESGEHFYKPVLAKLYDDDGELTGIECGNCGASWTPDEMKELVR